MRGSRISVWTATPRPLDLCISVFDAFPPCIEVDLEETANGSTEVQVRPHVRISPSETTALVLGVTVIGLLGVARDLWTWSSNRRRFFAAQVELCNTVWRAVADAGAVEPGAGGYRATG